MTSTYAVDRATSARDDPLGVIGGAVWSFLLVVAAGVVLLVLVSPASAHRSGCHRWHSCPSDHATYRWRGLLYVKPSAEERTSAFRIRVVYQGLVYYCKR